MSESQSIVTYELSREGDRVLLRIEGELDMSSVDQLEAAVGPQLADGAARLVVDVREVAFADSSALAQWVRWSKAVGEFELREPSALLRRVIDAMGLTTSLRPRP